MMVVRPVTEADNDALCRMELLAPQGTTIRLTERRFEFAARSRQFPGAVLYVAADDTSGDLAAVLGGAPVAMRLGGKERMAGHIILPMVRWSNMEAMIRTQFQQII